METTTTTTETVPATITRTRVEREGSTPDRDSSPDFIVWVLLALVAFAVCGGRHNYHYRGGHHRPAPIHHVR